MFKNRLVFLFVLVCLLAALIPTSDIDLDGSLDSLITEGFWLTPVPDSVTGLSSLLTRLSAACLAMPQSVSTLLVPPPIPTT